MSTQIIEEYSELDCQICWCSVSEGGGPFYVEGCEHMTCKECMKRYLTHELKGAKQEIYCPYNSSEHCSMCLQVSQVKKLDVQLG